MKFPTEDILSVATGCLCGTIGGVYEVCNFMTRDNLYTHQLPRASKFLEEWYRQFGSELDLLPAEGWQSKNPVAELGEMMDAKRSS
jgi:hypothetical protein